MKLATNNQDANLTPEPGDPKYRVSEYSHWSDLVWRFIDNLLLNSKISIGWDFILPDGTRSSAPQHTRLLQQAKLTAWALIEGDKYVAPHQTWSNFARIATGMRELIRWMNWKGLSDFAHLSEYSINEYIDSLPEIIVQGTQFYSYSDYIAIDNLESEDDAQVEITNGVTPLTEHEDGVTGKPQDDDKEITYGKAANRLAFLEWLYSASESLSNHGIPGINFPPLGTKSLREHTNKIAPLVFARTPPLPDEVALPLLTQALAWLEIKSNDVCGLVEAYMSLGSKGEATSVTVLQKARYQLLINWKFSNAPGSLIPWTEIKEENITSSYSGTEVSLGPSLLLRRLVYTVRDACFIVLLYFTGMRINEITSIHAYKIAGHLLPKCIISRKDKSGFLEMFFVRALLSKGKSVPEEEEWLIGCRPVGSTDLPLAVKAIDTLAKMVAYWKPEARDFPLFFRFSNIKGISDSIGGIEPASTPLIKRGMTLFIRENVDFSQLPDTSLRGENLSVFRITKGACIRGIHGRKTFAAYILETRTSLLLPLSRHFKHLNTAMTEASYFPSVNRLRQEADTERYAATVNFFMDVVVAERVHRTPLLGKMAPLVVKWLGSLGIETNENMSDIANKIRNMIEVHDLRLFFSDHGNCFIRANPAHSKCWDGKRSSEWLIDKPNFSARTPSVCAGCRLLQVDASHIAFWRNRALSLTHEGRSVEFGLDSRVLKARQVQAKTILDILERRSGSHE